MPKRIATISVVVVRKNESTGKNVRKTVEPGKPFNFTDAEIEQINKIHPTALRKPVNETAVVEEEPVEDEIDDLDTDDTEEEGAAREPTATEGVTKKPAAKKAAAKKAAAPAAGEDDDI